MVLIFLGIVNFGITLFVGFFASTFSPPYAYFIGVLWGALVIGKALKS